MRPPRLTLTAAGTDSPALALGDRADPRVQVWRDHDGQVCAYGYTQDGEHWMHFPEVASFRFTSSQEAVTAIVQPPQRVDVIRDIFHRTVLPMVLQTRGQEVLHASAVHAPGGVVAFCGVSGAGKSTIAYGLSQRGYPLWADDAVAFETSGRRVSAIPLPFRLRLRPDAGSFFDLDRTAADTLAGLDSGDQGDMEPAPLAALCVLKRTAGGGNDVAVEPLRLSSAFPAVLAHAYCFSLQDLDRKRRMIHHYLEVGGRLPVFEIRFRPGLEHLPVILNAIEHVIHLGPDLRVEGSLVHCHCS